MGAAFKIGSIVVNVSDVPTRDGLLGAGPRLRAALRPRARLGDPAAPRRRRTQPVAQPRRDPALALPHIHLDLYAHDQAAEVERLVGWARAASRTGTTPTRSATSRCWRTPTATGSASSTPGPTCRRDRRTRRDRRLMRPGPTNSLTDVAGTAGRPRHPPRGRLAHRHAPSCSPPTPVRWRASTSAAARRARARPTCSTRATSSTGSTPWCSPAAARSAWRPPTAWCSSLYAAGLGWPMGEPGQVVPIVPAAVLFDLGRGGEFAPRADRRRRCRRVRGRPPPTPSLQGCVGAGTGARAGGLKGAVGSASAVLDDGTTVAALVVVNSFGAPHDEQHRRAARRAARAGRRVRPRRGPERRRAGRRARPGRRGIRGTAGAARDGDDDRRHRHGRHPHQGAVPEGQRARARRAGPRDQPGAHAARRRHAVHPRDRRSAPPRSCRRCTPSWWPRATA